jgi:[ribosomal protein S18]-alanine N-acetyltransferase
MLRWVGAVLERTVSLRPKLVADEPFIARLSAQAFSDFDHRAGPRTLSLTQRDGVATRVAEREGQPLGFVTVEFERDGAWVQAIAVAANERGRGVGARLLAEAVRLARAKGARQLRLTTADANVEALELFLKCGFVIERRAPRYYSRGQDACILRRAL